MKLCRLLTSKSKEMRDLAKFLMLNSKLRYVKSYLDNPFDSSFYLEVLAENDIYFSFILLAGFNPSNSIFRVEIFKSHRSITTLIAADYVKDMKEIEEIIKRWS